ncbi:MAG: hypothetical protein BVN33_14310 [Proteobacteria bacterium ST_bin13]|jgi:hypothetical protein|uniref:hypothetical protein n=1 Tax=Sphingobium limneticum TaxID=1007511 RepID=UPI000A0CE5D4|nr:MAG: hypothetical protein BVN33_14310 [Proteobacteria bacterium ST_bin13]
MAGHPKAAATGAGGRLDLDVHREPVWPEHLRPVGEGSFDKEDFATWWARHGAELGHLHPQLCEQWIHRHWTYSRFAWIPLGSLRWRLETMTGEAILGSIRREYGGELHPEFDYKTFARDDYLGRHQTAIALDSGTWDYPMVLLSTPNGVVSGGEDLADVRLVLVEGHQRHRYLNALHVRATPPAGPHLVFILDSGVGDAGGASGATS